MDSKEEDPPRCFVDWSKIHSSLTEIAEINEENENKKIKAALIMKLDGSLLSVAGLKNSDKIISALVANIWKQFETQASTSINNNNNESNSSNNNNPTNNTSNNNTIDDLDSNSNNSNSLLNLMLLDCSEGLVAVTKLSRFLLCLVASPEVKLGEIKMKMNLLKAHLQPLNRVYAS